MLAQNFRLTSASVLLFLATGAASRAADPVVLSQPPSTPDSYTIWESASTPSGPVQITYDDFSFPSATSLSAVQWNGNYLDTDHPSANPIAPNTTSFTFTFYADNGGEPGAALASTTVAQADCAPVQAGTDQFSTSSDASDYSIPFYSFRTALPTPFVAAGGQRYWLSIVGNMASADTIWAWFSSNSGNQFFFHGSQPGVRDRAFSLEGAPAVVGPPTVVTTVTAKTANANTGMPGVFTLTLPAPVTDKLKVKYTLSGTAVNGTDYKTLNGKAVFKSGQSSVDVTVAPTTPPVGVYHDAFKKTVLLTVQPGTGYAVTPGKSAKVKITRTAGIDIP